MDTHKNTKEIQESVASSLVHDAIHSVSIVICTYNRAESLLETLESVVKSARPANLSCEIIVVDNNSSDKTKKSVQQFASKSALPVTYVFEKRQGIAYARNAGIRNAKGEIVAYLDDDVLVAADWLENLVKCFRETEAGAVGGKIKRKWLTQPPDWYTEELGGCLISQEWGEDRKEWKSRERHMVTANLAFRRSVFDKLGTFIEGLGRRGNELTGGEDREFYQRMIDAGVPVMYEPKALVYHKVEADRLTQDYFARWFRDVGKTLGHQIKSKPHFMVTVAPVWLWKNVLASKIRNAKARFLKTHVSEKMAARMWDIHYQGMISERFIHWRFNGNGQSKCIFGNHRQFSGREMQEVRGKK